MALISVLIPTYNRVDLLAKAIESVRAQTCSDWEIVIVDDGSTDNTRDVVRYSDRIRYEYQSNRGVSAARNHAFGLSNGRYIVLLDSDDVLLPQALEKLLGVFEERPEADLVYGDGWVCNVDGETTGRWSEYWHTPYQSLLDNVVVCNTIPVVRAAMMRRDLLETVPGPFDEAMIGYEDWDLAIRLVAAGARVTSVSEPVCEYRLHLGSKSLPTSQWAAERRQSLVRSRLKVLGATWFTRMSLEAREQFFYDFLTEVLQGDYALQEQVMASEPFEGMPRPLQGRLLYHLAVKNLSSDSEFRHGYQRMIRAIGLRPFDLRLHMLFGLSLWGPSLPKLAIAARRRIRTRAKPDQENAVERALSGDQAA